MALAVVQVVASVARVALVVKLSVPRSRAAAAVAAAAGVAGKDLHHIEDLIRPVPRQLIAIQGERIHVTTSMDSQETIVSGIV